MGSVTANLYVHNIADYPVCRENDKVEIRAFFQENNGISKYVRMGHVRILPGGSSKVHYHPGLEESFTITKGEAKLEVDKKTVILKKGDFVQIPRKSFHQIFNVAMEDLEYIAVELDAELQERNDNNSRASPEDL